MGAFVKGDAVVLTAEVEPADAVTLKKNRPRWLWAIPIMVFLSVYRFAVQPRPTAYVSPPIDNSGVRIHIQLPAGWVTKRFSTNTQREFSGALHTELIIGEHATRWPPRWLERWFPKSDKLP